MASTILTDVNFNSDVYTDTLRGVFTTKLGISNALAQEIPDSILPSKTGYYLDIPQFKTPTADSAQITTSLTTTVNALGDFLTKFPWMEREVAYGADQIIPLIASKDPTQAVAEMMGEWLAIDVQKHLISSMLGAFDTALASTHVYDDSGNTINVEGLLNAKLKLGDNMDKLTEIVMNSKVWADAIRDKIANITTVNSDDTYASGIVRDILGLRASLADSLTATAGVYNSFLGAKGALMYAMRLPRTSVVTNANIYNIGNMAQVELARVSTTAGGQDLVILRYSLACGVYGTAYQTGGGTNPTRATLETGSSWAKAVVDDKLIPLVAYKSK